LKTWWAGGTSFRTAQTSAVEFPGAASLRFEAVKKPLNFHLAKKEVCRKLAA
jgi:hypothetical protein